MELVRNENSFCSCCTYLKRLWSTKRIFVCTACIFFVTMSSQILPFHIMTYCWHSIGANTEAFPDLRLWIHVPQVGYNPTTLEISSAKKTIWHRWLNHQRDGEGLQRSGTGRAPPGVEQVVVKKKVPSRVELGGVGLIPKSGKRGLSKGQLPQNKMLIEWLRALA